ncbi:UDP-glucose 4-epimerase GalE [Microbacterium sp. XT11]|uniref:UDP-glucose 4-epimerase GalE n=1 Tax=Microbacterium sp. XT11 TaxID=367477 RepID=UPI00082D45F0|nr:UDP-glucose 4-epimerase GalE [Microbacterium sp. XT11]
MKVLITGGAGYIGSTIASACVDAGIEPILLDDLSTGRSDFCAGRTLYVGDMADTGLLGRILDEHPSVSSVIHCAAKIVVSDSVADPITYYESNVAKSIQMVQALVDLGVQRFVFSSSASIYDAHSGEGVEEDSPQSPSSPYAQTKAVIERFLADAAAAGALSAIALRYFNPVGADPRLRSGSSSTNPTHVLGRILKAHEEDTVFSIFGSDWPTRDGSAIRDYIHVWDLAQAHVSAITKFDEVTSGAPFCAINVGTGRGVTVKELVDAAERALGVPIKSAVAERRPGDQAGAFAIVDKAATMLGWQATSSLPDAIRSALQWSDRLIALNSRQGIESTL